ncbi:hypothetical protein [Desulfovibrio gilichinskyi]|uniref:EF hand n=1 Tax=Desulfovibrio gilichinskyi TaxID=1519643 RepID=A0A1X7CIT6_9BACT|nr:hypothetical protein [Desulfovibrio gilichinskyi]SME97129.1 EF hand [Desulfovibrio gilichinskyi]
MSVSSIGSYMNSEGSSDMIAQMQEARKEGGNEEFVSSMIQENDGDGDGFLSAKETGLNGSLFKSIDTNGDGLASAEELSKGIEKLQQQKGMMGDLAVRMQDESGSPQVNVSAKKSSSDKSGSQDDETSYDVYDLNKDGIVTGNEFLQAFEAGDQSLAEVVGKPKESGKNSGKSALMQRAVSAYQAQSAAAGRSPLGVVV